MPAVVFEYLNSDWYLALRAAVWGVFLVLAPVVGIVTLLQRPPMKACLKAAPDVIKKIGAFLQHQIDDPIKYPRALRATEYVMMAISYVAAAILFIYFLVLVVGWGIVAERFSFLESAGILGLSLVCAYWSAALKTQGNRELLRLRAARGCLR